MNSFQLSPRVTLHAGDIVSLSKGPKVIPTNGRLGPKGKFRIDEFVKRRNTIFAILTAAEVSQSDGGTYMCRITGGRRRHSLCPGTITDLPYELKRVKQ